VAGKARVHELAKELGISSKQVLSKLQDLGEYVKSPSSTVEAPVARRLRESVAGGDSNGGGRPRPGVQGRGLGGADRRSPSLHPARTVAGRRVLETRAGRPAQPVRRALRRRRTPDLAAPEPGNGGKRALEFGKHGFRLRPAFRRDVIDDGWGEAYVDRCWYRFDEPTLRWMLPTQGGHGIVVTDPRGDLGRVERQRQFLAAVLKKAASPATLVNPVRYATLNTAGGDALTVGDSTGLFDLAKFALAMRAISGDGGVTLTGQAG